MIDPVMVRSRRAVRGACLGGICLLVSGVVAVMGQELGSGQVQSIACGEDLQWLCRVYVPTTLGPNRPAPW